MKVWYLKDPNAPKDAIYIGRPSPWGNPYRIGVHGTREEVKALYERYLDDYPHIVREAAAAFIGKDIACHCKQNGLWCHGHTLAERVERHWQLREAGGTRGPGG